MLEKKSMRFESKSVRREVGSPTVYTSFPSECLLLIASCVESGDLKMERTDRFFFTLMGCSQINPFILIHFGFYQRVVLARYPQISEEVGHSAEESV
jgi:hypothetical protein